MMVIYVNISIILNPLHLVPCLNHSFSHFDNSKMDMMNVVFSKIIQVHFWPIGIDMRVL